MDKVIIINDIIKLFQEFNYLGLLGLVVLSLYTFCIKGEMLNFYNPHYIEKLFWTRKQKILHKILNIVGDTLFHYCYALYFIVITLNKPTYLYTIFNIIFYITINIGFFFSLSNSYFKLLKTSNYKIVKVIKKTIKLFRNPVISFWFSTLFMVSFFYKYAYDGNQLNNYNIDKNIFIYSFIFVIIYVLLIRLFELGFLSNKENTKTRYGVLLENEGYLILEYTSDNKIILYKPLKSLYCYKIVSKEEVQRGLIFEINDKILDTKDNDDNIETNNYTDKEQKGLENT